MKYISTIIILGILIVAGMFLFKTRVEFGSLETYTFWDGVSHSSVDVATSYTTVLSANPARQWAEICNSYGNNTVYLQFDDATSTVALDTGLMLESGECYTIRDYNLYTGLIYGIATSSTSTISTVEY